MDKDFCSKEGLSYAHVSLNLELHDGSLISDDIKSFDRQQISKIVVS
jgi:hypothetical protein